LVVLIPAMERESLSASEKPFSSCAVVKEKDSSSLISMTSVMAVVRVKLKLSNGVAAPTTLLS